MNKRTNEQKKERKVEIEKNKKDRKVGRCLGS